MNPASPKSGTTSRSRRKRESTIRARILHQADNGAEAAMWAALKARGLGGHKFVRQFPIRPYFADFLHRSKKLVIEVDGSQHVENVRDRVRDEYMQNAGFSVIRFWSTDVLKNRAAVCDTILAAFDGSLSENIVVSDLHFVFAGGRNFES